MPTVVLGDGSALNFSIHGEGSALLVPCARPTPGGNATAHSNAPVELVARLADHVRVIAFDYEAHRLRHPRSSTLTLDTVAGDMLAIADSVGAETFSYLGHSWLALVGPHLASVTRRVRGLAMGGLSPLDPPLAELLDLAMRNHRSSIAGHRSRTGTDHSPCGPTSHEPWPALQGRPQHPNQARQFVTFFDDAHGAASLARAQILSLDMPRLCFVEQGDALPALTDHILLDDRVLASRQALERSGWRVAVLDPPPAGEEPGIDATLEVLVGWLGRVAAYPQPARQGGAHTTARLCPNPRWQVLGQPRLTGVDRVDAYLGACGIPEGYFDDAVLRAAAERFLDFRSAQREHREARRDPQPPGVTTAGRPRHRGGPAGTHRRPGTERTQELLEIAIIRRLEQLRLQDRGVRRGPEERPGNPGTAGEG